MAESIVTQIRVVFAQLVERLAASEERCRAPNGVNNLRIGIQESIPLMETGEEQLACDILIDNLYEANFLLDQELYSMILELKRLLGLPVETWRYLAELLPSSA